MEHLVAPLLAVLKGLTDEPIGVDNSEPNNEESGEALRDDAAPPLTLDIHESRNSSPLVIICYQRRGKATHDAFWQGLHEIFSRVEVLEPPPDFDMPDVFYLLSCQR